MIDELQVRMNIRIAQLPSDPCLLCACIQTGGNDRSGPSRFRFVDFAARRRLLLIMADKLPGSTN